MFKIKIENRTSQKDGRFRNTSINIFVNLSEKNKQGLLLNKNLPQKKVKVKSYFFPVFYGTTFSNIVTEKMLDILKFLLFLFSLFVPGEKISHFLTLVLALV